MSTPPAALRFIAIERPLPSARLADPAWAVRAAFAAMDTSRREISGQRLAVAVGSRGIERLADVVRAVVNELRGRGARPFVVPAMGSHGGATAAGQARVLAGLGVTETSVGAPVHASMQTVAAGRRRVPISALAAAADGIVLVNRVKPHTMLTGRLGSGLRKMLAVGLGLDAGARALHAAGLDATLDDVATDLAATLPVLWALAMVEDARGELARVEGVAPGDLRAADERLLDDVRQHLPGLPFAGLDGLCLLRMGKNISGAGMDPNVIGMHRRLGGAPAPAAPARVSVLRLTAESDGNAVGVGMADGVPATLVDAIDRRRSEANANTSGWLDGIRLPVALASEEAVIRSLLGGGARRVLIARDTAHLERFLASPALAAEIASAPGVRVVAPQVVLEFDDRGRLLADALPL